jgi:t-SNARE complex subunit (syntaxin)
MLVNENVNRELFAFKPSPGDAIVDSLRNDVRVENADADSNDRLDKVIDRQIDEQGSRKNQLFVWLIASMVTGFVLAVLFQIGTRPLKSRKQVEK